MLARLLTHVGCDADLVCHLVDQRAQLRIAVARRMHQPREQRIDHLLEAPLHRQLHLRAPRGTRFRGVGPRHRVQQRQFQHPLRRLAHDLEGQVAAHRQADEREARRGALQHARRHARHVLIAGVIGDHDGTVTPQCAAAAAHTGAPSTEDPGPTRAVEQLTTRAA